MGSEPPRDPGCLSLDVLVRCADGHSAPEEQAHVRDCPTCQAHLAAAASLGAELLAVAADREELETFKPDEAHARVCLRLTDRVLAQIAASPERPEDGETVRHLCQCPYCRQRLLVQSAELSGRPAVTSRLMAALLDGLIEDARREVMAKVPWCERQTAPAPVVSLRERLRVFWRAPGQLLAAGLEALLPAPQRARACGTGAPPAFDLEAAADSMPADAPALLSADGLPIPAPGDAEGHIDWTVPLPGGEGSLALEVSATPDPEAWEVTCSLSGVAGPASGAAVLEVYAAGGQIEREAVPLRSLRTVPMTLRTGDYELRVAIGPTVHAIPLSLGESEGVGL